MNLYELISNFKLYTLQGIKLLRLTKVLKIEKLNQIYDNYTGQINDITQEFGKMEVVQFEVRMINNKTWLIVNLKGESKYE